MLNWIETVSGWFPQFTLRWVSLPKLEVLESIGEKP